MESVKGMNSYSNKKKKVKRLDSESEGVGVGGGGSKFGFKRQENRVTIHLASRSRHEMKEIKRKLVSELEVVRRLVKRIEDVGSGEKRMPKVYKERMVSGKGGKSGGKKQVGVDAKVVNKLFKSCGVLLERLMKHKHGWVFNAPVDPLALGLHDYFDVIKNPMDLGTVKSRLDKNWYNSPMEFAEDVRLTFHNAMTYNPQGHDVYIMAEVLLKLFEEKWKVIEAEFIRESSRVVVNNEVGLPLPTPLPKRAPPQVMPVPEMRSEPRVPAVQPIEQPPKVSKLGRTPSLKKPKARDINKRDMTYDEKQKLSIDLQNLPSEKLDNVVHIIKKRLPSLSQKDDEIEVDIDTFDTETLWELDRFVANYKKGLTKNKRKAEFSNDDRIEAESEFPNDVQSELPIHERIEVESEFSNRERIEVESEFLNQERTEAESEFPNQERTEVESEFPNYERMEVESEFPNQERIEVEANVPHKDLAQVTVDVPKEAETDGRMISATSPVQMQKQVEEHVAHGDKSSSSSSSSSNSGSSSSGSDSDSSSGAGSDAGHSSKA